MVTKAGCHRIPIDRLSDAKRLVQAFYHWIIHACQTKLSNPEALLSGKVLFVERASCQFSDAFSLRFCEAARWFATRMEKSGYKANAALLARVVP